MIRISFFLSQKKPPLGSIIAPTVCKCLSFQFLIFFVFVGFFELLRRNVQVWHFGDQRKCLEFTLYIGVLHRCYVEPCWVYSTYISKPPTVQVCLWTSSSGQLGPESNFAAILDLVGSQGVFVQCQNPHLSISKMRRQSLKAKPKAPLTSPNRAKRNSELT